MEGGVYDGGGRYAGGGDLVFNIETPDIHIPSLCYPYILIIFSIQFLSIYIVLGCYITKPAKTKKYITRDTNDV